MKAHAIPAFVNLAAVLAASLVGACGGGETTIIEERVVTETVREPAPTDGASESKSESRAKSDSEAAQPRVLGQILLSGQGEKGTGIALITERNGERSILVQARGLKPTQDGQAYELWLFNGPDDAVSLGAQLTDSAGNYQGAGRLPGDYAKYESIDLSREKVDQDASHSGESVLRGRLDALEPARPGGLGDG